MDGKSISLKGGYADCSSNTQTSPNTTIGGGSHFGLLHIVNANDDLRRTVRLDRLTLENGENFSTFGGAVRIVGRVRAVLSATIVRNSLSTNGGGIWIFGSAIGDSSLELLAGSGVIGNDAIGALNSRGGGIWCTRAHVALLHPTVSVSLNRSFGSSADSGAGGGGIFLSDCRFESVAGGGLAGVVGNFSAARGGGIHAVGSQLAFRHSPGASTGAHVSGNGSDHEGGGISLHQSAMGAQELAVFSNTALGPGLNGVGGGVVAAGNSTIVWNRDGFGVSTCAASRQSCNRLSDNEATSAGAGLSLQSGSAAGLHQIEISGNRGGTNSAVSVAGSPTSLTLGGALITGNTSSGPNPAVNSVVRLTGGASAGLSHATIADNPGHGRIIDIAATGNSLILRSSVISEDSGGAIVSTFGAEAITRCLMVHHVLFDFDHVSNTVRPYAHRGELFMAPDAGDYRPNPFGDGQLLIDYCDGTAATDGLLTERGIDLPEVPNRAGELSGPYDIGAYELAEVP